MNEEKLKEQSRILYGKRNILSNSKQANANRSIVRSARIRNNRPIIENKVIKLDIPLPRKPDISKLNTQSTSKKAGCSGCSR